MSCKSDSCVLNLSCLKIPYGSIVFCNRNKNVYTLNIHMYKANKTTVFLRVNQQNNVVMKIFCLRKFGWA